MKNVKEDICFSLILTRKKYIYMENNLKKQKILKKLEKQIGKLFCIFVYVIVIYIMVTTVIIFCL